MHLKSYVIIVNAHLSIEHDITNVKGLSSITIELYDNDKREWLQLLLLQAGKQLNVVKVGRYIDTQSRTGTKELD